MKLKKYLSIMLVLVLLVGCLPAMAAKVQPKPATKIDVSKESVTLKEGGKAKFTATIWAIGGMDSLPAMGVYDAEGNIIPKDQRPDYLDYSYTLSKNRQKITITLKGYAYGHYTFRIKADDINVYIPVTVKPKKPLPAESITLDETEIILARGKSQKLAATVGPEFASTKVTWKSDNKKVATVNSKGKVVAKKEGTAIITAKTKSGVIATCVVTVMPKGYEPPVEPPVEPEKPEENPEEQPPQETPDAEQPQG